MANKKAYQNSPISALKNLEGTGYTQETLPKVIEISNLALNGLPKDAEELQSRITEYFRICAESDLRPGIEKLSLALGTDRKTFWAWCEGMRGDKRFTELCRLARQIIISMLEDANQTGKINPASGIFFLKNWANYTDAVQIETKPTEEKPEISLADLPKLDEISKRTSETDEIQELPDLPWIDTID